MEIDEDRIRELAYRLSQDPERSQHSDVDNWLEAERRLRGGLAEAPTEYTAATTPPLADPPSQPGAAVAPRRRR